MTDVLLSILRCGDDVFFTPLKLTASLHLKMDVVGIPVSFWVPAYYQVGTC